MKDLIVFLKQYDYQQLTYENILQQIVRSIESVMNKNLYEEPVWYIVFDPIIRNDDSIINKLKQDTWQKRTQYQSTIHNLTASDIVNFIQYFYYPLKDYEGFKDRDVRFVMSAHESDVMCGSIKKQLQIMYPDLPLSHITIYSTDSDLLVHSYPFNYYSLSYNCMIRSKLFFNLFDEDYPQYLPAKYGCDYVQHTLRFPSKELLYKLQYQNLTDKELLISSVFSNQNLIENIFQEYDCEWKKKIDEYIEKCNQPQQL